MKIKDQTGSLALEVVLIATPLCCSSLKVIHALALGRFVFIQQISPKYYSIGIVLHAGGKMVNKTRHQSIPHGTKVLNSLEKEICQSFNYV